MREKMFVLEGEDILFQNIKKKKKRENENLKTKPPKSGSIRLEVNVQPLSSSCLHFPLILLTWGKQRKRNKK